MKKGTSRPIVALIVLIVICIFWGSAPVHAVTDPHFAHLAKKLIRDGFDAGRINELFDLPCMSLNPKVLLLRLTIRESKIDYERFYQPEYIEKCREFMASHKDAFDEAYKKYGVPPEIIVGILMLETKLGTYTGQFLTLQSLATHAVAGNPEIARKIHTLLPEAEKQRWSLKRAAERLGNRTAWSYNELKAFLKYLEKSGGSPCDIKGSFTGAIGYCQFQPSNIKTYGRDGNGDNIVDLFQMADAIHSASAYLNLNGWRDGMSKEGGIRVLKTYNNSRPYALTVLEIAKRVKK